MYAKSSYLGNKKLSASRGLRPHTLWPGALPLDPAGGTAPRSPICSRRCYSPQT